MISIAEVQFALEETQKEMEKQRLRAGEAEFNLKELRSNYLRQEAKIQSLQKRLDSLILILSEIEFVARNSDTALEDIDTIINNYHNN